MAEPEMSTSTVRVALIQMAWWPFLRDRRLDAYGDLDKRFRD